MSKATFLRCSTVAMAAALSGVAASAQITVVREGERAVHRDQRYGYCVLTINGVEHVSGTVFLPSDDFYGVFLSAFDAYARANIGSNENKYCNNDLGSPSMVEDDVQRWISNNPRSRYVRNGWTGGFPTQGAQASVRRPAAKPAAKASTAKTAPAPAPALVAVPVAVPVAKGPTPNQLKYQRELAEYQQRLADIERVKAAAQAKLASDKASAQLLIEQHRQEMDVNRQQVAAAERAKRQYEQELAAQQAQAAQRRTKQDREALADWPEAVTVCELNAQDPQSKFGNWRCEGPLQFTYAKLGNGGQSDIKAMANVSDACGGKVESVRDLAMVGGYRVFGCSFGLHPKAEQRLATDKAAKFGLAYIPGRIIYRCPTYVSYCRTR